MTTLMSRIKTTDFLSQSTPTQLELILTIQAMRVEGLKNAKKPKKRKTKAKGKAGSTRKPGLTTEQKALKALNKLSPAQFALIQKKLNEGK
jgi:hypothetical protein